MLDFSEVFAVANSTFGGDVTIGNYNAAIINEFDFEPVVDINVVSMEAWKEYLPFIWRKWPNSQITECSCSISHNAPFRTEPRMQLFHIPQCSIQNRNVHIYRNVHISVLNGALLDMEQVTEINHLLTIKEWMIKSAEQCVADFR